MRKSLESNIDTKGIHYCICVCIMYFATEATDSRISSASIIIFYSRHTYATHTLILPWIINHEYCFDLNSFMPHWYKSYKLYHRSHTVITNNTYHIPLLGLNEHLVSTMKYFKNLSSSSSKNLDDVVRKRFEIDEKKTAKIYFQKFLFTPNNDLWRVRVSTRSNAAEIRERVKVRSRVTLVIVGQHFEGGRLITATSRLRKTTTHTARFVPPGVLKYAPRK